MRPYLVIAAAALACAAAATPSQAQEINTPYCATFFAHGDTGSSSHCKTVGLPALGCANCGVRRTVHLVVATGAAEAVLTCDGYERLRFTVTGPGDDDRGIDGGNVCDIKISATADGTTAAVTSIGSYYFILA